MFSHESSFRPAFLPVLEVVWRDVVAVAAFVGVACVRVSFVVPVVVLVVFVLHGAFAAHAGVVIVSEI